MSDDPLVVDGRDTYWAGNGWVFKTPSRSRDVTHFTVLYTSGVIECSCEGFKFHQKCRHVDYVNETRRSPSFANMSAGLEVGDPTGQRLPDPRAAKVPDLPQGG